MPQRSIQRWLLAALILLPGVAPAVDDTTPVIALIIDDLGNNRAAGEAALGLPGEITYSILPHTPFSKHLAQQAHAQQREVMLHLPMQSVAGKFRARGQLDIDMTRQELRISLGESLESVPHARGINNHMGSLLTRYPVQMGWLMEEMHRRGDLYFVDSRTTRASVAEDVAADSGVPVLRRHVFLDHHQDKASIEAQMQRLVRHARKHGVAVGIGHPYRHTLDVLSAAVPELQQQGIKLVSVSRLIDLMSRRATWQASLSPSPRAAKNSKPSP